MRLLEVLEKSSDYLAKRGVEQPRLQVELMMAHVLEMKRMELYLEFERELSRWEMDQLRPLVVERGKRVPLQHILGETEFYGLRFQCGKQALIPRPESEVLVEWVVDELKEGGSGLLYDVGTGSGVLAVTLAQELPEWRVVGCDVSEDALALAKENGELHGGGVEWQCRDLLDGVTGEEKVVVANLPYLTDDEMAGLSEEVLHDPHLALRGGRDGLDLVRRLVLQVVEGGLGVEKLFLEVGIANVCETRELLEKEGASDVEVRADLLGRERFVKAVFSA